MKNEIRLVCVDLDGTLLKNNKTIGSKTIAAAKKAAEKGIEIVPVTGRPLAGTPVGEYIFGSRRVVPDIRALFEAENKCADEIFINLPNESERDSLADLLAADETLGFCRLEKNFLEVLHRGTDKGTALEFLCSYFKIGRENAAAFGDNDNDLPLLAAAGLPVAMGNASEKVKNLAKTVTETNENDGVAMLLAQF